MPAEQFNPLEISIDLDRTIIELGTKQAAFGIIIFLIALLGTVLNPSFFLVLDANSIYLRIAWRYIVILLLLIPKLIFDGYRDLFYFVECISDFAGPTFGLAFLNTLYNFLMYYSITHTYMVHSLLLCGIPSTFAVAWKIASKQFYSKLEYIGLGINIFGAYLCCCEGAPINTMQTPFDSKFSYNHRKGCSNGRFCCTSRSRHICCIP